MSTASDAIRQTLTVMEAGFTLARGMEEEFARAHDRFGPVAAAAPGFRAVIGGPIANSSWLYFSGKFATPAEMDQWHHSAKHRPVQRAARERWFDAYYIRKWRLPAADEPLHGRLFAETAVARTSPLSDEQVATIMRSLTESLPDFNVRPFETMLGDFEQEPYQFVGPLDEVPQEAPVRYLLLTHWDSPDDLEAWQRSSAATVLHALGDVSTLTLLPIQHRPDERDNLSADGTHREWARPQQATAVAPATDAVG